MNALIHQTEAFRGLIKAGGPAEIASAVGHIMTILNTVSVRLNELGMAKFGQNDKAYQLISDAWTELYDAREALESVAA